MESSFEAAPIPLKCVPAYERKFVLDGIMAIGKSWNILDMQPGKLNLEIRDPIVVSSSKFKGIENWNVGNVRNVIRLALARSGPFRLSLLLAPDGSRNSKIKFSLEEKRQIKTKVVEMIKSSIATLSETSLTRRDNMYNMLDEITISSCNDWKEVGECLQKQLECWLRLKTYGSEINYVYGYNHHFLAAIMGQDYEFELADLQFYKEGNIIDIDHATLQLQNVTSLSLHIAYDFLTDDTATHVSFFDAKYITSRLPLRDGCKFYQQAGLEGFGNLQYAFTSASDGHITNLQFYSRWTDMLDSHPKKRFVLPTISNDISQLLQTVFLDSLSGKIRKACFNANESLLTSQPTREISSIVDSLASSPDQRAEFVWSGPILAQNLSQQLNIVTTEIEEWKRRKEVHLPCFLLKSFSKDGVLKYLNQFATPAINTIHEAVQIITKARYKRSFVDLPDESIMTQTQFCNILTAETLMTFLFRGNLSENWEGIVASRADPLWTPSYLRSLGLRTIDVESKLDLNNISIYNSKLVYSGDVTNVHVPSWINDPRVDLIRQIKNQLDGDEDQLLLSIWKLVVAQSLHLASRQIPTPISIHSTHDICRGDEYKPRVISTMELVQMLGLNLLKSKVTEKWNRDAAGDVIREVAKFKNKAGRKDQGEFNMDDRLMRTLDDYILSTGLPFLLLFNVPDFVIAIPGSIGTADYDQYLEVWKNCLKLFRRLPIHTPLIDSDSDAVDMLLQHLIRDAGNFVDFNINKIFNTLVAGISNSLLDPSYGTAYKALFLVVRNG